jgi:hypothetical protein
MRRIKIYVRAGDIFIAKITCHLRITSGLYWLGWRSISLAASAISQLCTANGYLHLMLSGHAVIFTLLSHPPNAMILAFLGAARPQSDRINWKQKGDKRGADR